MAEETVKPVVKQILRALNYLKKNHIVHRDLKLENIMLESNCEEKNHFHIKLIDFGLSLDLNE